MHQKQVNHFKRVVAYTVLLAALILLPSACGNKEYTEPVAVAVAIGNHANAKTPNVESPEVIELIKMATKSFGYVSVVAVDGSPSLAGSVRVSLPGGSLSESKLEQIATEQTAQIVAGLKSVRADDDEVDTLAALELSVRSFSSAPQGCRKHIIVLDTGLSTAGVLSFTDPELLWVEPEDIADWLEQQRAIPNFLDIEVTWMGLGDVAPPQATLSGVERERLKNVWRCIIEQTGGTIIFLDSLQGPDTPPEEYPAVTPVSFPGHPVPRPTAIPEPIILDKEQLEFIGDSAEYRYPAAAQSTLRPIAEYLIDNEALQVLLVGTTATGNRGKCLDLKERLPCSGWQKEENARFARAIESVMASQAKHQDYVRMRIAEHLGTPENTSALTAPVRSTVHITSRSYQN